jgi:peptide/nickel transport system substrate-binding protein
MIPKSVHGDPARRAEFGIKTPIGTGPYKAELVDANKGITLTRNPNYPQASACKPAASIGRIHIAPLPDQQTQIAQLAVGGLDALKVAEKDQSAFLSADPRLALTATQGLTFNYMAVDASGRSGNKPLADIRVRQALFRAIDRDLIAKSVVAGDARVLDELCFKSQFGCGFSVKPEAFDRAAAKKLLSEAGYPEGFGVELLATPTAFGLAEALAGELRKIGVRAKVDRATFTAYRDKQRLGKQQILINEWSSGGLPDAHSTVDFFFGDSPRDYWQDTEIKTLSAQAVSNLDDAKRREIYTRIYDRAVERAYVLPISTRPAVFVHTRELEIDKGSIGTYGAELYLMRWK